MNRAFSNQPAGQPGSAPGVRFFCTHPKRSVTNSIRTICLLSFFVLALQGCEETDVAAIDPTGSAPTISNVIVSPPSLNIDSLPSSGGSTSVTVIITASANDIDGDLRRVSTEISRPSASSPFLVVAMRNDGVAPDASALDDIFTGTAIFQATRAQAGAYLVSVGAWDQNQMRSGQVTNTLLLTRNNSRPLLDSASLTAPDTLTRPTTGSILFSISIAATDSDGLADVRQVYMQNLATSNRDFLLDDGGLTQPGGISSGDELAGDGIFTVVFQLPSTVPVGRYDYILQAADTFADTSRSIPYSLVIQ